MKELQNIEAEQATLGSLLLDPEAIHEVSYFLRIEDFAVKRNGWVYEGMLTLSENGVSIDVVTVADHLDRAGRLPGVGGMAYLTELVGRVPSALHVREYARIVARRAIDRRLEGAASTIAKLAYSDQTPPEKLAEAQAALEAIEIINGEPLAMDADQAADVLGALAAKYAEDPLKPGEVRGWSMGVVDLDKMLRGLKAGLYLVGGVTHAGKSAFVLQIAANVADQGGQVLVIETEDTAEATWARLYALVTGMDLDDLERGLEPDDLTWYYQMLDEARGWQLEVLARAVSVAETALEVKTRQPDLVVVDNLETPALIYPGEGEWQRFRSAAYGLLTVAQENKVPILTTMQVSKHKLADRANKVPQMEDLYGADGPAQAASVVLTLHREDVWNIGQNTDPSNTLVVSCFKDKLSHRGVGKRVELLFGPKGKVRSLTLEAGPEPEPEPEYEPLYF